MSDKIKVWCNLYNCNYKKNIECKKIHCKYCGCFDDTACSKTTKWKYAKRTPLNYFKKISKKILEK